MPQTGMGKTKKGCISANKVKSGHNWAGYQNNDKRQTDVYFHATDRYRYRLSYDRMYKGKQG